MKIARIALFLVLAGLMLMAQTQDLGQKVYYSEAGGINICVDAAVASRMIDSPYVMFVLYMGTDENLSASLHREDVILVHNEKEYYMPSFEELRENYQQDTRDMRLYGQMNKESLIVSKMRYYRFQWDYDFFPSRNQRVTKTDEGGMDSIVGFKTKAYFKNPGFKTGDTIIIKIFDRKNPDMWGAVAAVL